MLTIFSIPKPFEGHIGIIQRNALASWRRLDPSVQIILLGDELGMGEAADQFGAEREPRIRVNQYGTPLVNDAFAKAIDRAKHDMVMFTNADMLYDRKLLATLALFRGKERFLITGERCDVDITDDLSSESDAGWENLFARGREIGRLHGPSAMDYFAFPRDLVIGMPDFAIGRVGWDAWVIWKCRRDGIQVVDATESINAIHQNHSYSSLRLGYQHHRGPERDLNLRMAGGLAHMLTLREASHKLVDGAVVRPTGVRAIVSCLAGYPIYQQVLGLKRWAQQYVQR